MTVGAVSVREWPTSSAIRTLEKRDRPLLTFIIGALVVLHGLAHLLYSGQSWRLFELQVGMVWPDNAWTLSGLVGNQAVRPVAGVASEGAGRGTYAPTRS
jgi:hypothetical protein